METIKIKGIDEQIYYTISKQGLPIYIWNNEYAKSFYLSLNVKFGSLHTEFMIDNEKFEVPNGIAHFMEHIKFNVDKNKTANDLFDPLGSDINAFTTYKYTSYLVYGTSKIEDNLNNLLDYVYNPFFTKEIIKKEKGIIASEINMGKDQPFSNLNNEFNKCIFHKEKYKYLISGEVSDIKKIGLEDIKLVYNTFYQPQNMFLVVTGNVNPYEIEKLVNENLYKKEFKKFKEFKLTEIKEPRKVVKDYLEIKGNVEVPKAKIGLKIERKAFKKIDLVKLNIILNIILASNFGDTSDLKEELLKDELITFINTARYVQDDYVIIDITLESKYVDEAIKRIVWALDNLTIDEETLKRKINSSIATLVLNYEDVENVNSLIQNYIIYYGDIIPNLKDIYADITIEEVREVIKEINTKEMTIIKMEK